MQNFLQKYCYYLIKGIPHQTYESNKLKDIRVAGTLINAIVILAKTQFKQKAN